jgi:uncharacterized protein YjiS (DUF1127 family)
MRTSHTVSFFTSPPPVARALGLVATRLEASLARALLWPIRFYRGRRELSRLAAMSEHELRDIGLNRSDLANATALPGDADPTRALAQVVRERRRWRRV